VAASLRGMRNTLFLARPRQDRFRRRPRRGYAPA
jgi:hypothetical protein